MRRLELGQRQALDGGKAELQKLADEAARRSMCATIYRAPHITQSSSGRPLTDRVAIVELIGATITETGLEVECALASRTCEKGLRSPSGIFLSPMSRL